MSDAYAARIVRLERQVQFLGLTVVLLATLCLVVLARHETAQASSAKATQTPAQTGEENRVQKVFRLDATVVVSREFDLIDDSNRVLARLVCDPDHAGSPAFLLKYPNNKAAFMASVDTEGTGASVSTYNIRGVPTATMSTHSDGSNIALFDENEHVRIIAEVKQKGPQIMILNPDMTKYIWRVPVPVPKQ